MQESTSDHYRKTDNFTMRITLETLQNILGKNGLKSILNHAALPNYINCFPPDNDELLIPVDHLHKLYHALIELFGNNGSRALELRIGKEICRVGIEKRSGMVKALRHSVRLLPETKRLKIILTKYIEEAEKRMPGQLNGPRFTLKEDDDFFFIIDKDYHVSNGIRSDQPVCNDIVGILQYLLEWTTGHKYAVEEIECRATGYPADVFKIPKAHKDLYT